MAVYQGTRTRPPARTIRLPALRLPALASVSDVLLTVGALACFTIAAGLVAVALGVAVGGLALAVIRWLSGGPTLDGVATDLHKLAQQAHPADRAAILQAAAALERIGQQP